MRMYAVHLDNGQLASLIGEGELRELGRETMTFDLDVAKAIAEKRKGRVIEYLTSFIYNGEAIIVKE